MNNFNLNERRLKNRRRKTLKKYSIFIVFLILILCSIIKLVKNTENTYMGISLGSYEEDLFTICIDAGHGEWDLGASGIYSDEKDITLDVSLKLGALLEASGDINVVYTRTNDFVSGTTSAESLSERVTISNNSNADLFISIHCNSYPDDIYVDGLETWYDPNDSNSKYYASLVQNELSNLNYTSDRGIITYDDGDELYVINNTNATAILLELGFITNPYDEDYLNSSYGQAQCAEAIYNATLTYISSISEEEESESY